MSTQHAEQIATNAHYTLTSNEQESRLVFTWKRVAGLSIGDLQDGIAAFADGCRAHKPASAVIDATQLDPDSPAVAWVSLQKSFPGQEEYATWWAREIVPVYNAAGISGLAVATGNTNAPGELNEVPPGVEFKMAFFADLNGALGWNTLRGRR